jgi:hypothetical protein
MKFKITKRDLLFCFFGLLTFLFIHMIVHWEESINAFREAGISELEKIEAKK